MSSKLRGLHTSLPPTDGSEDPKLSGSNPRRQANVYDAVAGRVASNGFIPLTTTHTVSASTLAVPPEEVLFRRKTAPQRYEEVDFYWAEKNLAPDCPLPDSDLLKAIHTYAADFYHRATIDKGQGDYGSMDETALLALGILLQETAREILGTSGDFAFVEVEEQDDGGKLGESNSQDHRANDQARSRGRSKENKSFEDKGKRKKRKLNAEGTERGYDIPVR